MQDARQILERYAADASRARRRRRAAHSALATLAVAGVVLAAGVVLLAVVAAARPWIVLALVSVAVVGTGLTTGALLRRESASAAARWIARLDRVLGGAVADALEFAGDVAGGRAPGAGSTDLARAHVERAAALARHDAPSRHARAAVPRLPVAFSAAAVLAALVAWLALPVGRERLLHGPGAAVADRVRYGAVEITLHHPEYLGMEDRTDVGTGDVQAPAGTHVTVTVKADRPLRSAYLEVDAGPGPASTFAMEVSGLAATGRLVALHAGSYRIRLEGQDGAIDPEPPRHLLDVRPDALPEVRLRAPRSDVSLPRGEELPFAFAASDDHGVAEVVLVVAPDTGAPDAPELEPGSTAGGDGRLLRIPLETCAPPCRSRNGSRAMTAEDLGIGPGGSAGSVWAWIEARDDDQVSGPKWAASRKVRVQAGQGAAVDDALAQEREEAGEKLLAALAAHLVAPPEALKDARSLVAAHGELASKVGGALDSLARVVEGMRHGDEDVAAAAALHQMRTRLESLLRTRDRRLAMSEGSEAELRAAVSPLYAGEIEELERDVLFFDMWADRRAAIRASDGAADLREALARLQALLASASASPEAIAEALAEAERLAAALEGTLAEVARAAGASPQEAQDAASSLRELLGQLEASLAAGRGASASELAEQASEAAARLAGLVDELSERGAAGDPELAAAISEARHEIRALSGRQASLRDETNALRDEARDRMSPDERGRADALFKDLLKLADEAVAAEADGERGLGEVPAISRWFSELEERDRVATRLSEIGTKAARGAASAAEKQEGSRLRDRFEELMRSEGPAYDVERLMGYAEAARENLGRLRQVLADREIAAARGPARWAKSMLEILGAELGEAHEDLAARTGPFRESEAKVAEILTRLDELERLVDRTAQETLTAAQRQQLDAMANRQGALLSQSRSLAARLRELGADAPFLGQEVAKALEGAAGHMDSAAQSLHGTRPGPASESQGEAVAQLDEASKAMAPQQGRPGQGQGRGRERRESRGGREGRNGRTGAFDRDEVEIPGADAFRVPREFREEILEAMRESPAPQGYEEAVREYYRSLVE